MYCVMLFLTELYRLMSACLAVLVGNAEAERMFSCQNRIKSKLRPSLTIDHLSHLIRLSYAQIPAKDFRFSEAVDLFLKRTDAFEISSTSVTVLSMLLPFSLDVLLVSFLVSVVF